MLNQKIRTANIDTNQLIKVRFIRRSQRGNARDAGVDKEYVNAAIFLPHMVHQRLRQLWVARVGGDGLDVIEWPLGSVL